MDKEKITYEELVAYLARATPAPGDPAGLTREIMARLERAGGRERPRAVARLVGWTSGIAAALLLALLAGEVALPPRAAAPVAVTPAPRDALTGEMLEALEKRLRERETRRRRPARVPENYSRQLYKIMHHEND